MSPNPQKVFPIWFEQNLVSECYRRYARWSDPRL